MFESINSDIYKTWGKNKKRIDLPAYGPEFYDWKLNTNFEIQKIVLDYLSSRKVELLIDKEKRKKFLEDQVPKEEYETYREYAISKAEEVAVSVSAFIWEKGVKISPNMLAVGLDGSSLYNPRLDCDTDIWIMFREINGLTDKILGEYFEYNNSQWKAKNLDVRLVTLKQSKEDIIRGSIHCLAFPHRVIKKFNLKMDDYQKAIEESKCAVMKNKKYIYQRCKYFYSMCFNSY